MGVASSKHFVHRMLRNGFDNTNDDDADDNAQANLLLSLLVHHSINQQQKKRNLSNRIVVARRRRLAGLTPPVKKIRLARRGGWGTYKTHTQDVAYDIIFLQLQRTSFAAQSNVLPVTCVTVAPTVFPMRRDLSIDLFPTKMFAACPFWFNIGSIVSSIGGCWSSDTPGCTSTEDVVNKPWNLFRPCRN